MKACALLATLSAFVVAAAPAAYAYSVHFSFSDPDNWIRFVANPGVAAPWDGSSGVMTNLDIYFDPATAILHEYGDRRFNDPTKDYWTARIETTDLGVFLVRRPLDVLRSSEHSIQFSRLEYVTGAAVEFVDFEAIFAEKIAAGYQLPGPLIPTLPSPLTIDPDYHVPDFKFDGGTTFFPVEGLQEGYGYGAFHTARAEIIGSITAVPEPATFGFAAAGLLGLVLAVRRRAARDRRPLASGFVR